MMEQLLNPTVYKKTAPSLLRKRCYMLLLAILMLSILLFLTDISTITQYAEVLQPLDNEEEVTEAPEEPSHGFLVNNEGCRMPAMDAFSSMVLPYVQHVAIRDCSLNGTYRVQTSSDDDAVYLLPEASKRQPDDKPVQPDCCVQEFRRAPSSSKVPDNNAIFSENCRPLYNRSEVGRAEFVKITCKYDKSLEFSDFHSFVPLKAQVEQRCSHGDGSQNDRVSVLIIGIDAVSRLNMHRTMPSTVNVLQELGGIEMLGYNKVGDNTFPNLVPVLTGLSVKELENECWPTTSTYFDSCPFVWKHYKGAGYRTAFAEDASWMGVFNYQKNGFAAPPTDYYWKTFSYVSEAEIGHDKDLNANICVGPRLTPDNLLSYANKFIRRFVSKRYFGLFWETSVTHDDVNFPRMIDNTYAKFIHGLYERQMMNSTVLIVLSDHGIRWGGLRNTYQGMVEERLPVLNVILPPGFKRRYPTATANLKRNRRSLTTPYDLHETLKDLVHVNELVDDKIRTRTHALREDTPRGISLFLRVPAHRTCNASGIEPHWCTCHDSSAVDKRSDQVHAAADFIVRSLNAILQPYRKSCAKLGLDEILDASVAGSPDHLVVNTPPVLDYTVSLRTAPGKAFFEATVRDNNGSLSLTGPISRTNLYHDQSRCMHDYRLKLYCFCV